MYHPQFQVLEQGYSNKNHMLLGEKRSIQYWEQITCSTSNLVCQGDPKQGNKPDCSEEYKFLSTNWLQGHIPEDTIYTTL